MIYLIILSIVIIILLLIYFKMKHLRIGCINFTTGGPKTGKSSLNVHLGIKDHKKQHFIWKIKCAFCRLFRKKQPEEPLLYSNIPLTVPYVELTEDILLRKKRQARKSTTIIDEASLIANSTLTQIEEVNIMLSLYMKLYGHATHGGKCFVDTHCVNDTHFAIKRVVDKHLHIISSVKLPFFMLLFVREMYYSDDGSVVNTANSDIHDNTYWLLYPKSVWKKFDAYSFSASTDKLPLENTLKIGIYNYSKNYGKRKLKAISKDLKTYKLSSFNKKYIAYYEEGVNYEAKNN